MTRDIKIMKKTMIIQIIYKKGNITTRITKAIAKAAAIVEKTLAKLHDVNI
jgi:nucleoid DNA-binding protein